MKRLILFTAFISFFSIQVFANDYPVTVRGKVFGSNRTGNVLTKFPLAGAKVELVDSDADGSQLFDDVMGTAIVNADGTFEVSGMGGDPGDYSWSRPDVYVRFVFNYKDKVRLTDELDRTRYSSTPEHDHNNFEGVLDIGTWVLENDLSEGESSEAAVWYAVCRAWDDYVSIMGEEPKPGYCDVEYWSAIYAGTPWTSDNTIHWPIHYSSRAAKHEFAHLVRHSFDGDRNHFNWDVTRFRYARYHDPCAEGCNNWSTESKEMNEAYAFNEGWAEFWAGEVSCDMGYSTECEAGVASTLAEIEATLAKTTANPRAMMCRVLKNNPGAIHSIGVFVTKLNELAGQTLYAATTRKMAKTRIQTNYVNTKLPPGAMSTYSAKNLGTINAALTTVNEKINQKGGKMKVLPCKGQVCDVYAASAVNSSGLSAKKNLLLLQQDMMQQNAGVSQEILDEKRSANSLDAYMNDLRSNYNGRIISIIQQAFKEAIARLQTNTQDPYSASMMSDIQAKSPFNSGDRGGRGKKVFAYSFNLPATATKEE